MVLEFCSGGSLASYIKIHGRVQEKIARSFMQQLGIFLFSMLNKLHCFPALIPGLGVIITFGCCEGAGMEVLHSHFIIHRDLKPEV